MHERLTGNSEEEFKAPQKTTGKTKEANKYPNSPLSVIFDSTPPAFALPLTSKGAVDSSFHCICQWQSSWSEPHQARTCRLKTACEVPALLSVHSVSETEVFFNQRGRVIDGWNLLHRKKRRKRIDCSHFVAELHTNVHCEKPRALYPLNPGKGRVTSVHHKRFLFHLMTKTNQFPAGRQQLPVQLRHCHIQIYML